MAQFRSGFLVPLILSTLIAAASAWLTLGANEIYCDRLPSLTICATLSAFAIALCFRQLGRGETQRWLLLSAILIAGATLFVDAHFVLKYRGFCAQLQDQIRQMHAPAK